MSKYSEKTAIYTLTLTLRKILRGVKSELNESKEFIKKNVETIFYRLLGNNTKVKYDVSGSADPDYALGGQHIVTINYTFYYNKEQAEASELGDIWLGGASAPRDSNGDLELVEDDIMIDIKEILSWGPSYILAVAKSNQKKRMKVEHEWIIKDVSVQKDDVTRVKKKKSSKKRHSPVATAGPAEVKRKRKRTGSSKRNTAVSGSSSNNTPCKGKKKTSCKKPYCEWNIKKRTGKRGVGSCVNN